MGTQSWPALTTYLYTLALTGQAKVVNFAIFVRKPIRKLVKWMVPANS